MNNMRLKFLSFLFLTAICISVWAESGIYVGGYFRRSRTVTVPTLKNSGFTYAILFNINVEANGSLTMDGDTLCANGVYVFGSTNPNYIADVTALRTSFSTIRRVECCIGGWTNQSYLQISNLIKAQGTGTSSILYKNFQALKNAIPAIEAINNDDEYLYDVDSETAFHVMLYDIGFKTTIAPYMRKSFWQSFVTNVNSLRPGAVDRVDLQCYDGGAGNNPNEWDLGVKMTAGMLSYTANGATAIPAQMTAWKNTTSIVGGFYWVYNDNSFNLQTFAAYINNVFGDGALVDAGKMVAHTTIYPEKNYGGEGVDFEVGKYNALAIKMQNMPAQSAYSLKVNPGFSIDFYKQDSLQGDPVHINQNTEDLSSLGVENAVSWKVNPDIDASIRSQSVFLKNRKSGLFFSLKDNVSTSGTLVQQKVFSGDVYQKWAFWITKYGSYRILNSGTNNIVQIKDASVNDFANLEESAYTAAFNQEFVAFPNGLYYKLIPLNSMKYVSVENGKENQENAYIVQSSNWDDLSSDWQILPAADVKPYPTGETVAADIYCIQNKNSGLYMSLDLESGVNEIKLVQKEYSGSDYQQWRFVASGDGVYQLENEKTGKIVELAEISEGCVLQQNDNTNLPKQKFVLTSSQDGFYKIVSYDTGLAAEGKQIDGNTDIVQSGDTGPASEWKLIKLSEMSLISVVEKEIKIYPTLVSDLLYIDCNSNNINQIQIFDLQGREIFNSFENKNIVDVSVFQRGMYIIKMTLKESDMPFFCKFVKK